ncbi:helicase associated domain-containing protein [Streptomyces sp. NPDC093260]|uniref:helicase associated domain-containing protein n=1 Tax=Streptomyces sp. NPDC093260 TaxID=3155073 RepID=UPI00343480DD
MELAQPRMEALEACDPGWCPEWDIAWQRSFRLALAHVRAGGKTLAAGEVIAQGEDLGAWTAAQRRQWDTFLPAQRRLLENTHGPEPATADLSPRSCARVAYRHIVVLLLPEGTSVTD